MYLDKKVRTEKKNKFLQLNIENIEWVHFIQKVKLNFEKRNEILLP